MTTPADHVLAAHKAEHYRGIVRVSLNSLHFDHPRVQDKHRTGTGKNVRRLKNIFLRTGCFREHDENVIYALVDDADLEIALAGSGMTSESLRDIHSAPDAPSIPLRSIQCLSGLHRIEAAKQCLDENDKWWIVKLLAQDTPDSVLDQIIESYGNEQRYSDGEIFRKIRLYHKDKNEAAEDRWWARLDNSKPKDLRQLLKKTQLIAAFDSLVDMPGLWDKVQLGALHRLLSLKCDEEMMYYLQHIAHTWSKILTCNGTILPLSVVDNATVDALELLAPRHSAIDKELVLDMMKRKIIFPRVLERETRQILARNLCASPGLIPSLWTFFETLKYLEPICEALKLLLGNSLRRTLRSTLMAHFVPPEKNMIQISESREAEFKAPMTTKLRAWMSYVDLWAFCGRNFQELTTFTPRKESGEAKPAVRGPNSVVWQRLAQFALSRGFKIGHAEEIAQADPYSNLARDFLRKANPTKTSFTTQQILQVVHASRLDRNIQDVHAEPDLDHIGKERRCGRPFDHDAKMDRTVLFLPAIYNSNNRKIANLPLVRRDLFLCMFGPLSLEAIDPEILTSSGYHAGFTEPMDCDPESPGNEESQSRPLESEKRYRELMDQFQTLQERYRQTLLDQQGLQNENKDLSETSQQRISILLGQNHNLQHDLESLTDIHRHLQAKNTILEEQIEGLQNREPPIAQATLDLLTEVAELRAFRESATSSTHILELERDAAMIKFDQAVHERNQVNSQLAAVKIEWAKALLERDEAIRKAETSTEVVSTSTAVAVVDPVKLALQDSYLHDTWRSSNSGDDYEIFVATSNNEDGLFKGVSFLINHVESQGLPTITTILEKTKTFLGEEPRAMNVHGKYLTSLSALYIYNACSMHQTIFVGKADVLSRYVGKGAHVGPLSKAIDLQRAERTIDGKKRRLEDEPDV